MPLYDITCAGCGLTTEIFRSLAQFDDALPACACGGAMARKISPPMINSDIEPYRSMLTGEMITSRSRHRDHLRDHNCTEVGNERLPAQAEVDPGDVAQDVVRAIETTGVKL